MRGVPYGVDFYRGEVERLELLLTQAVSAETRVSYQSQLASARQRLADLETKKCGSK